ncbi:MAG: deoxyribonuclease IV [Desulfobulbus sp.]
MPLLGAHESIAGGLHLAFDRITQVGGASLQIFTANQRQWKAKALTDKDIHLFHQAWQGCGSMPVASHASYLINLAAEAPDKVEKSITAFCQELIRCRQLGISLVVIHPGSHGGRGTEAGLASVNRNLEQVMVRAGILDTELKILLETTAGQGTSLGSNFEELGFLLQQNLYPEHLGVCVDTCHIFAAGYDIRQPEVYAQTMAALTEHIGLEQVHFFHLNDSQKNCGSRVDRHAHIGEGCIGLEGFRLLLNDKRFHHLPMTLETDKGPNLAEDIDNLQRLRDLMP